MIRADGGVWRNRMQTYDSTFTLAPTDALILHFNALQEAVQPEGDTNFKGLLSKIEQVCRSLPVPVIAKEVGWGFSEDTVRRLLSAGVAAIDVAGSGGTSWSQVEMYRAKTELQRKVAATFVDWGIPTAEAVLAARRVTTPPTTTSTARQITR